jgi:hypothetical protein
MGRLIVHRPSWFESYLLSFLADRNGADGDTTAHRILFAVARLSPKGW